MELAKILKIVNLHITKLYMHHHIFAVAETACTVLLLQLQKRHIPSKRYMQCSLDWLWDILAKEQNNNLVIKGE